MMTHQHFAPLPLTRMITTVGLAVALLLAALPSLGQQQLPIITNVLGIAGGGSISIDNGHAHVSLMATNITPRAGDDATEDPKPVTVGQVKWLVSSGGDHVVLESTVVEEYGPMPDNDNGRVIRGLMVVNGGEDEYPFVVHAIDGGRIGDAVDSIGIRVGDAVEGMTGSNFSYAAAGPLETGDLQLISFEPEEAKLSD